MYKSTESLIESICKECRCYKNTCYYDYGDSLTKIPCKALVALCENIGVLDRILNIQKEFQKKFPVENLTYAQIVSAIASEAMEIWHDKSGRWWKEDSNYYCTNCGNVFVSCLAVMEEDNTTVYLCPKCESRTIISVEEHLKEESIDILHFLNILWLKLGMDEKEIFEQYCKKMGVNIKRQEDGY